MSWTDDRVEELKKLWAEGLSASQIARQLGGVTRNAVIGKVHRLGLSGRGSPSRSDRPKRVTMPKPQAKPVMTKPIVVEEPVVLPSGDYATVMTITDSMCKWPIGDPTQPDFRFCGRPSNQGEPYCDGHARMAFQPAQAKRVPKRQKI